MKQGGITSNKKRQEGSNPDGQTNNTPSDIKWTVVLDLTSNQTCGTARAFFFFSTSTPHELRGGKCEYMVWRRMDRYGVMQCGMWRNMVWCVALCVWCGVGWVEWSGVRWSVLQWCGEFLTLKKRTHLHWLAMMDTGTVEEATSPCLLSPTPSTSTPRSLQGCMVSGMETDEGMRDGGWSMGDGRGSNRWMHRPERSKYQGG